MAAKKKSKTKSTTNKSRRKKNVVKGKGASKRMASTASKARQKSRRKKSEVDAASFGMRKPAERSAVQSGDLQGFSRKGSADSESVDELLEEGNAFEAEVVDAVEHSKDPDTSEVRTREVPEDDVPAEYLDKDDVA